MCIFNKCPGDSDDLSGLGTTVLDSLSDWSYLTLSLVHPSVPRSGPPSRSTRVQSSRITDNTASSCSAFFFPALQLDPSPNPTLNFWEQTGNIIQLTRSHFHYAYQTDPSYRDWTWVCPNCLNQSLQQSLGIAISLNPLNSSAKNILWFLVKNHWIIYQLTAWLGLFKMLLKAKIGKNKKF